MLSLFFNCVELKLNIPDKHKIYRVSFWLGVAILFAAPIEVFHSLLELSHILFEWIESALDFIIDLIFDTQVHKTQVVVFYIIIAALLYGLYRAWKGFPAFYRNKKQQLLILFFDEIANILAYWHESIINKTKLIVVASGLLFLLFF